MMTILFSFSLILHIRVSSARRIIPHRTTMGVAPFSFLVVVHSRVSSARRRILRWIPVCMYRSILGLQDATDVGRYRRRFERVVSPLLERVGWLKEIAG